MKVLNITGKWNKEEKGYDSWKFPLPLTKEIISNISDILLQYEAEFNNYEPYGNYDFIIVEEGTIVPMFFHKNGSLDDFLDCFGNHLNNKGNTMQEFQN